MSDDEKKQTFAMSQVNEYWRQFSGLCQQSIYYENTGETECNHPDNQPSFGELCQLKNCPYFEDV